MKSSNELPLDVAMYLLLDDGVRVGTGDDTSNDSGRDLNSSTCGKACT